MRTTTRLFRGWYISPIRITNAQHVTLSTVLLYITTMCHKQTIQSTMLRHRCRSWTQLGEKVQLSRLFAPCYPCGLVSCFLTSVVVSPVLNLQMV